MCCLTSALSACRIDLMPAWFPNCKWLIRLGAVNDRLWARFGLVDTIVVIRPTLDFT